MVFKKGSKPINHKEGCTCFRCSKIPWNKGKTGVQKHSEKWKNKMSNIMKGKTLSLESRKKISDKRKGIKLSEKTKEKISIAKKLNPSKYWLGKHHSEETKKKISQLNIGQVPWNKGRKGKESHWFNRHHSEETKKKLKIISTGKRHSLQTRQKISQKQAGKSLSKITKERLSESLKLAYKDGRKKIVTNLKHNMPHTQETKKKLRLATIKYFREVCGGINPMLGHNETAILDFFEQTIGYRIVRQLCIEGFFLDGYIPELNLAIEIDEEHHNRRLDKDKHREQVIRESLGCKFLRIKDYD